LGRSRGGFCSKIHLVCDGNGNPLSAIVSAGHRHDSAFFEDVLNTVSLPQQRGRPRTRPQVVIADKGYDGSPIRSYLRARAIQAVIPPKELKKESVRRKKGPKPVLDEDIYRERNIIERLIGHLKNCRRIATRYEKYANSFLAMVNLAFIKFYLKKYFSDTL
jgi:transposase